MFYELLRQLLALVPALTGEARDEYAAAIDKHEAEHTAKATASTTSKGS